MSNCKEIQQNVREIEILKKELEETAKEALKTGDISAVARLKKALNEKMIELQVNIIDAHPSNQEVGLGERWRIAKEKGFDCVYQFGPEGTAVAHKGLHMMLIDKQGTIVAGPYDGIDQFMGGIATAAQGNERFYIDQKGREITSERFERISWFSEGFAYVGKGDVFWYIDTNGKRLTEQNFVHASPFKEGRALVQIAGEGYSYIDTSGNKIGEEEFSEAQDFSEGLAAVKGHNRPAHFIDTSGKDPFGKDFVATSSFVDGIARVSIFTTINGSVRQTFINKYGEFIHRGIETKYDQAEDFSEGRAAVKIYSPGETWNYIDTNGRYASLAGSFEKARSFQGGFGRVRRSSRWNYVGMNRELLLSEFVEDAGDFSDGIAEIKKSDGLWYFIDTQGTMITHEGFEETVSFHCGVGWGKREDKWYLINKDGEILTPKGIECKKQPEPFDEKERLSVFLKDGNYIMVDTRGKTIFKINAEPEPK